MDSSIDFEQLEKDLGRDELELDNLRAKVKRNQQILAKHQAAMKSAEERDEKKSRGYQKPSVSEDEDGDVASNNGQSARSDSQSETTYYYYHRGVSTPKDSCHRQNIRKPALFSNDGINQTANSNGNIDTHKVVKDESPLINRLDDHTENPPEAAPAKSSLENSQETLELGLAFCSWVLDQLYLPKRDAIIYDFKTPVNEELDGAQGYYSKIKHTIALSDIREKLRTNQYADAQACKADFELMFTNCFSWNRPGFNVYNRGRELQTLFRKIWGAKDQSVDSNGGDISKEIITPGRSQKRRFDERE